MSEHKDLYLKPEAAATLTEECIIYFASALDAFFQDLVDATETADHGAIAKASVQLWQLSASMTAFFKGLSSGALQGSSKERMAQFQEVANKVRDVTRAHLEKLAREARERNGLIGQPTAAQVTGKPDSTLN